MKIVIRVDPETRTFWKNTLREKMGEMQVYLWDEDEFDPKEIDFAVVWAPPKGMIASLPNLRAIFSVGAGISHITDDPTLPRAIPIIRTTGEVLRQRMCEYVALHTLRIHRRLGEIEESCARKEWKWFVEPPANTKTVGIMGMGNLGFAAAKCLKSLGFKVRGLARHEREVEGIEVFGAERISEFLAGVDILVSMLPGTKETENIICKETINQLPKGAWVINVGRGSQVDDEALIGALDTGHLAGAVLDVFRTEPLPKESKFWGNPKILITNHTASAIEAAVGGEIISNNIRKYIRGEEIRDMVNREKGY